MLLDGTVGVPLIWGFSFNIITTVQVPALSMAPRGEGEASSTGTSTRNVLTFVNTTAIA